MSNELTTTEQTTQEAPAKNVINYVPVFPVLTANVLLDLPVEHMVEDVLKMVGDQKNCPGGYSSLYNNQSIDNLRGVKELREAIYGVSCAFGREMKFEANYDKSSIQLWVDVMRRGNYHTTHNHPRGVFAGTFMIRSDPKMSPVTFVNPNATHRMHDPFVRQEDLGPFTADAMVINPEVGSLVIWPSWLQYQMPEMTEPGPRISFGFNIDFLPPGA